MKKYRFYILSTEIEDEPYIIKDGSYIKYSDALKAYMKYNDHATLYGVNDTYDSIVIMSK